MQEHSPAFLPQQSPVVDGGGMYYYPTKRQGNWLSGKHCFRIWATNVLKQHIVQGYTVNQRRLAEKGLSEMEQAVALLSRTLQRHELVTDEGKAILEVVSRYAKSWSLLLQYDADRLALPKDRHTVGKSLDYRQAQAAIATLKSDLAKRGRRIC